MPVTVLADTGCAECPPAAVRRDARHILRAMGEDGAELTVVLVDDSIIRDLNRRFRRKDRATDVLAFAAREGESLPGADDALGDVVISLETAARQARRRRRPLAAEVRTLLVHGILHLLGYDHEHSAEQARIMSAVERELALILAASDRPKARKR